jgi:hypothetical protein
MSVEELTSQIQQHLAADDPDVADSLIYQLPEDQQAQWIKQVEEKRVALLLIERALQCLEDDPEQSLRILRGIKPPYSAAYQQTYQQAEAKIKANQETQAQDLVASLDSYLEEGRDVFDPRIDGWLDQLAHLPGHGDEAMGRHGDVEKRRKIQGLKMEAEGLISSDP